MKKGFSSNRRKWREKDAQREAAAATADSPARSWRAEKRPILRFALWFVLMAVAFNVFYYAYFSKTQIFDAFLHVNAVVSAALMRLFGTDVSATGPNLAGPRFSMTVAIGCDAIQPASLFFFAVLASPVPWRARLTGLLIGTTLLLLLNVVRIMSLYYCGSYLPRWFEMMHIDIWQTGYIILALLAWILWALWAKRPTVEKTRATA